MLEIFTEHAPTITAIGVLVTCFLLVGLALGLDRLEAQMDDVRNALSEILDTIQSGNDGVRNTLLEVIDTIQSGKDDDDD